MFREVFVKIKFLIRIKIMTLIWISKYQNYILYIEVTHQILFGSAKSFKSYCVLGQDAQTNVQTDRRNFLLVLSPKHTKHGYSSK